MSVLFNHAQDRQSKEIRLMAEIHGVKFKSSSGAASSTKTEVFEYNGDPESVKHLSEEQRKAMTDRLLGKHTKAFKKHG